MSAFVNPKTGFEADLVFLLTPTGLFSWEGKPRCIKCWLPILLPTTCLYFYSVLLLQLYVVMVFVFVFFHSIVLSIYCPICISIFICLLTPVCLICYASPWASFYKAESWSDSNLCKGSRTWMKRNPMRFSHSPAHAEDSTGEYKGWSQAQALRIYFLYISALYMSSLRSIAVLFLNVLLLAVRYGSPLFSFAIVFMVYCRLLLHAGHLLPLATFGGIKLIIYLFLVCDHLFLFIMFIIWHFCNKNRMAVTGSFPNILTSFY